MKHNLKTRPYLNDYPEDASRKQLVDYAHKCAEYFEDLKEELQQLNERDQEKWDKHLSEENGSCYCLASDVSCLPNVIKERKEILGENEGTKP